MPDQTFIATISGRRRSRRAFTLIEILIVGAIIALFAGLALFSVQQMYDSNKRKAMFDETKNVGTALAIARDDIGFFPRIHLLGTPETLITFELAGQQQVRPAFDTYGYLSGAERVSIITANWHAPYSSVLETRRTFSQGAKFLVKMRLPEPENLSFPRNTALRDISFVDWPSDVWGNPYVVYLVSSDRNFINNATNPLGLRFISTPSELPDYWTAVVSYGPNGVPGGSLEVEGNPGPTGVEARDYRTQILEPAMLYIAGDLETGNNFSPEGMPAYTLKSGNPAVTGQASLRSGPFLTAFPRSVTSNNDNLNQIGIRDPNSDDVYWVF